MSSKKINARIQKWRVMINEGLQADPLIVKSRIRKGIPTAVRPIVWPQIIKLNKFIDRHKQQYTFDKLINTPSKSTHEISLDIPRTFPEEEDSKILRKSLNNVLKAISIAYPKVGYCQGMNFLALRLLQIVDDEEAFWIITYLLETDPYLMKNFIDPTLVQQQTFVFKQILRQFVPNILQRFQSQNLAIQAFTVKWFMTVFSAVLEQQMFYRVFEIYLNEGWPALYAVALTLFKLNQEKILSNSIQQNILLINSQIFQISNINDFIEEVCKYQISFSIIEHYASKCQKPKTLKQEHRIDHHKPNLPVPQQQGEILSFQSKSQAVSFEVFAIMQMK